MIFLGVDVQDHKVLLEPDTVKTDYTCPPKRTYLGGGQNLIFIQLPKIVVIKSDS